MLKPRNMVIFNMSYPSTAWLWLVACLALAPWNGIAQGIPEPPLVIYGAVRDNTTPARPRLTTGTLVITIAPVGQTGTITASAELADINLTFSYVLFTPCETDIAGVTPSPNVLRLTNPAMDYRITSAKWNNQDLVLKDPSLLTFTVNAHSRGALVPLELGLGAFPSDSDTDGDGLPDWWEELYFGGPTAAHPHDDPDRDGATNREEYMAGTDPTDPDDTFKFFHYEEESPGVVLLQWWSVPGKKYSIWRSSTITAPPHEYTLVVEGITTDTGRTASFRDTDAGGVFFYRVSVHD